MYKTLQCTGQCWKPPNLLPGLPSQRQSLVLFNDTMALKYLITGATGGLGKQVLRYFVENVPLSDFAAASSKPSNKSMFENRGIAFRHVDYNDSESLDAGLRDVENLLFISSNGSSRIKQHERLIEAAKKAGVEHV